VENCKGDSKGKQGKDYSDTDYGDKNMSRWIPLIDKHFKHLPQEPACYAIYIIRPLGGHKIIYIGTTAKLRSRIANHMILRVAEAITDDIIAIKYKVILDMKKRIELESRLIRKISPRANFIGKKAQGERLKTILAGAI
jgi:excinuclease UvrABC nuclease subunit